jgi:hypothetical protein
MADTPHIARLRAQGAEAELRYGDGDAAAGREADRLYRELREAQLDEVRRLVDELHESEARPEGSAADDAERAYELAGLLRDLLPALTVEG